MKLIITGATGSLGRALVTELGKKGHQIIAVGRVKQPPEKLLRLAEYRCVDITRPFELPEADACIHAAARSDDAGDEKEYYAANVIGTLNAVEAAKKCSRFLHISSSSVYLPSDVPLKESMDARDKIKELSPYGRTKLLSEHALLANHKHGICCILRPRALYGPGDIKILPRMLRMERNGSLLKPGDMNIHISMTHYLNLVKAVECCLEEKFTDKKVYNVTDDKDQVLINVVRTLTKLLYEKELPEKKIPVGLLKILSAFNMGGFTPLLLRSLTRNMVLDITEIKKELAYKPVMVFDDSLNELKKWVDHLGGPAALKTEHRDLVWK